MQKIYRVYQSPSLVEELLARGVGLDGELELGVDGGDAHVDRLRHLGGGGLLLLFLTLHSA